MTEPHVAVLSQVQQFLDRQHGLYIDGRPGPAQSEKRLAIFDPATGQEIASTADANEADVDNAVMSAWRAFVSRRWAGRLPAERERILLRFADLVEQHSGSWRNWKPSSRANPLRSPAPLRLAVR